MLSLKKRASKLEYDLLNHNYDLEDYCSKKGYYDASFNDDSEDNSLNSNGKMFQIGYRLYKKNNCLAYLHRYAICHAALVTEAVTDIFESSSSTILTSKLDKRKLNVMFLGGGPGNDFVGFLTALNGRCDRLFDLDVTIVDKMSGWEDIFTETVKELRKGEGSYEKVGSIFDEVNIFPTFIKADLSEYDAWTAEMKNKLKTADIVFLVKALSHVPDSHKRLILMQYRRIFYGPLPSDIDYTKKDNCLAYLHRYAVCHTALVAEVVTDIFESSQAAF
ncbi:uncharacterized protein CEXT_515461 [Caerostris extrusa]|uniref:Uncharacterized protein n=1 Tax=Caerostris extrusa TaxID=172846 RepID=A0AAV4Q6Y8_CAEEX|nr:uncharacterized protein CEXT_515461 [Caerostris extrusa]